MTKAKKILYVVGGSMLVGAVLGMLYAPAKGRVSRRKIGELKRKIGLGKEDHVEDLDRETLMELRSNLREQLRKIDMTLEQNPV